MGPSVTTTKSAEIVQAAQPTQGVFGLQGVRAKERPWHALWVVQSMAKRAWKAGKHGAGGGPRGVICAGQGQV